MWGDIFFTRSSLVLEGIAYSNIYLSHSNDVTYDGHLMKITPDQNKILPPFAEHYFKFSGSRRLFMARAKQSTMTTISQEDIKDIPIPLPSLKEQKEISFIIDNVTKKILHRALKINSLKNLKKGLMNDLLTGKVRVK